ncbi:fork head domain-containing protein [Colletotrichum navitas]|uniref:Fork head domain-containing protein n=1 Tax=Colletotrichum navitas TaxID=681940 RepID=A0AAD8PLC6_9PEZI|nr:fork head domain-containing protein [Colletotrichum navitas]KAK1569846.1 fork head domain-containing protein [Colletotrichum navitas]
MPGDGVSRQQQYIASTTQAPSTMAVGTDMVGDYNTVASAHQQHQFPAHDHQRQGYYHLSAVSQPYQSPNMNQTAWPSPQGMSSDDFDNVNGANANYSYRGQTVATAYHPSTLSPRSWPAAAQTAHPASTAQFDLPFRPQEPVYDGLSNHVAMPTDDLRGADLQLHLHYDNGALPHGFEPRHVKSEHIKYESSPSMDALGSPYPGSPASFGGEFSAEPDMMPDLGGQLNPPPKRAAPPKESTGGEEPYAKLIHRALLDAPRRSMTLQELYKWFQDNTDKTHKQDGGTGWQNSIRHNLSMNDAFKRREKTTLADADASQSGTEKRVSEWYLVDAYIKDIKPTTHFRESNSRKGTHTSSSRRSAALGGSGHRRNTPPRSASATHYQNPDYPNRSMPGRAISGRRGGRATTSARNARRQRSQTGSVSPILGSSASQNLQHYPYPPAQLQGWQARAGDMQRRNGGVPKGHVVEGMRHHPVMGHMGPPAPLLSNGGAPAVTFMGPDAPRGHPQAYQLQQFGMADVSGVYTSSPPADDVIYGWGPDAHM